MARMREKAARAHRPTSFPSRNAPSTLGPSTKRDKRQIKHSILLSRVHKNSSVKRPLQRNRKAKVPANLNADLSALVDALPDTEAGTVVSAAANVSQVKAALTQGVSIKSRPGLQKRREAVSKAERERFARNLAAMTVTSAGKSQQVDQAVVGGSAPLVDQGADNRAERWAALRNHIQQSMTTQGQS